MRNDKTYLTRMLALLTGAAYVIISYRVPALSQLSIVGIFAVSALEIVPVTLVLYAYSERNRCLVAPLILLGAFIGIMIDVISDTRRDRNLFPIEIAFVWAVLGPSVIVGSTLGWWLTRNRIVETKPFPEQEKRFHRTALSNLASAISAGLYVTFCFMIARLTYIQSHLIPYIVLIFVLLVVITLVLAAFTSQARNFSLPLFIVGAVAGVVIDLSSAMAQASILVIQIVLCCAIFLSAIAIGSTLGS